MGMIQDCLYWYFMKRRRAEETRRLRSARFSPEFDALFSRLSVAEQQVIIEQMLCFNYTSIVVPDIQAWISNNASFVSSQYANDKGKRSTQHGKV